MTRYSRQDVLRILQVSARQLQGWERAGLVDSLESYTFQQLSQLRKLRLLSSQRIRSSRISASVAAMQRVSGMANPLLGSRRGVLGFARGLSASGSNCRSIVAATGFRF